MSKVKIPERAIEAAQAVAWSRYGSNPDAAYVKALLEAAAPHLWAQVARSIAEDAKPYTNPDAQTFLRGVAFGYTERAYGSKP